MIDEVSRRKLQSISSKLLQLLVDVDILTVRITNLEKGDFSNLEDIDTPPL